MKELALTLPGFGRIDNAPVNSSVSSNPALNSTTLPDLVSRFANVGLFLAGTLLLVWFTWGVFQYILAGGKKEDLAKARARITWSIVGFIVVIASFFVSQYAQAIFFGTDRLTPFNRLTPVSSPAPGENPARGAPCIPTPAAPCP